MKTNEWIELPMNAGLYFEAKNMTDSEKTKLLEENGEYMVWANGQPITETDLDLFLVVKRFDGVICLEHKNDDFRIEDITFHE